MQPQAHGQETILELENHRVDYWEEAPSSLGATAKQVTGRGKSRVPSPEAEGLDTGVPIMFIRSIQNWGTHFMAWRLCAALRPKSTANQLVGNIYVSVDLGKHFGHGTWLGSWVPSYMQGWVWETPGKVPLQQKGARVFCPQPCGHKCHTFHSFKVYNPMTFSMSLDIFWIFLYVISFQKNKLHWNPWQMKPRTWIKTQILILYSSLLIYFALKFPFL